MSVYDPLREYLRLAAPPRMAMTFKDIEAVIERSLPRSAYAHEAWWSNNTAGHSHARAWVEAGWRAEQINLKDRTLVFARVQAPRGVADPFGALRGSVTFVSGVDLTELGDEVWDAASA